MAAINVLTVTYFLAIENYPILQAIFPTFAHYILTMAGIGVPLLVVVGYVHYKRSQAFTAEADISLEVNRYLARNIVNSELNLKINTMIIKLFLKKYASDSLLDQDKKIINDFLIEVEELTNTRTVDNLKDVEYFKKLERLKSLSK
jgi:hypothetical protein